VETAGRIIDYIEQNRYLLFPAWGLSCGKALLILIDMIMAIPGKSSIVSAGVQVPCGKMNPDVVQYQGDFSTWVRREKIL
jgi:hypothetical protein